MFEHVVLRRTERGNPITVGEIIEALLYYQKVHVIIDRSTLFGLLSQIGPGDLVTLLRREDISAVYCEEMLAIYTDTVGSLQVHTPVAIRFQGRQNVEKLSTPHERLSYEVERVLMDKSVAHRFVRQFLRLVPIRNFSGDHFVKGGVSESVRKDLMESGYIKNCIRRVVSQVDGGYDVGDGLKFDVVNSDLGFYVFHNIDLSLINARRLAQTPAVEPLTIANLLTHIQDAKADLTLASFYGGDFITSQAVSEVIKVRHEEVLRRATFNADARKNFTEVVLPDSPKISEVVDKGEKSFKVALVLLDRATRFKSWLKSVNPDEGLVRSYIKSISSEGLAQRLPVKSLRYMLTLALDSVNPVAGFVAGAADNFIVDKLFGGWRPNHFISSKLQPFVGR